MFKSVFKISKMDCPSEENLIRMQLQGITEVVNLDFDIEKRVLMVFHTGNLEAIESAIAKLNLNDKKISTEVTSVTKFNKDKNQSKLLWTVLIINFGFFILEIITGIISKSMGLVADSLDMLADAFVYGLSLLAVGGTILLKKRIAKIAGYFQMALALLGFMEVLRRFFYPENIPNFTTMIIISILALVGNAVCLFLLQKSKDKEEAHIKASMIFTSNDVIINIGVILAGFLVYWLHSKIPDLVIGSIVFVLVAQGAIRILKLSK